MNKQYNLKGLGANVELGKNGPEIVGSDSSQIAINDNSGNASVINVAAGTDASHAVNQSQLETITAQRVGKFSTTVSHNSGNVSLGTISANSVVFSVTVEKGAGNWTDADSDTNITVGDDADPSRLFTDFDVTAQVVDETDTIYTEATELKVYVTAGRASAGTAKVTIIHSGTIE